MKLTKDTFFEHISTKDYKTIDAYHKRIENLKLKFLSKGYYLLEFKN